MLWEETITLGDGSRIHVRPVRPSDRETFVAGWEDLSGSSRFLRFLGPRRRLTDEELAYLTEVDGVDHVALGAVTRDADGREGPVAVGRFVRLPDHPRCADVAVTVVDAFQRRGVGALLLHRLVEAARRRGIRSLRAEILPENEAAKRLIRHVVPQAESALVGSLVRFRIPVDDDVEPGDCP